MSDPETDDTDALLAYKPPTFGAIENFLGLSVGEISYKINSLSVCENLNNNRVLDANDSSETQDKLDTSDFFNSKGELVLSGLSEWSDSDGDSDAHSEAGSVASSASTNSITVLKPEEIPLNQRSTPINPEDENEETESLKLDAGKVCEKVGELPKRDENDLKNIRYKESITANGSEKNQITTVSKCEELQASDIAQHINNSAGNLIQFSFDKYKSPNYGVRYSPGFGRQGINILKPSRDSGWRVPPGLENDPQIFTRAPNFRTPGGYKPPKNPKPQRDLTEEQVEEEVRKMYAFPEEIENEGENDDANTDEGKSKNGRQVTFYEETESESEERDEKQESSSNGATSELENQIIPEERSENISSSLKFDFTNGIIEPPEFGGKGIAMKGKPIKRKLIPGGGDGNTVGSIPNLNFGLRDLSQLEVKERPITRTRAWVTGSDKTQGKESKEVSLQSSANALGMSSVQKQKKVNFSDLDKLWRDIRDTKLRMDEEVKNTTENLQALSISDVSTTAGAHSLNIDFDQSENSTLSSENKPEVNSILKSDNPHYFVSKETSGISKPSFHNVRVVKKPSSEKQKLKSSVSCLAGRSIDPYDRKPNTTTEESKEKFETLSESDLDSILKEADIEVDDFEDILDKFSEEMPIDELFGAAAAYSKNEQGEEMVYNLDESEISDWAKSGAGEYLEKYHEEKYKRQRCESEIECLQKELLELKQQNAVLDGGLKKKDAMFLHISMAWNRLSKGWKSHEAASKAAVAKLQKDQQSLLSSCRQSKERILQYEKELAIAVEVSDSFKSKIHDIEADNAEIVQSNSFKNKELSERVKQLEYLLEESQKEKEATVRALRDCQTQLDDRKLVEERIHSELLELEQKTLETTRSLDKATERKETLENHLQSVTSIKTSLETEISDLHKKLRQETESKSRLQQDFENTITEKVKQESDRLHEYYNRKVQEILTAATEKAAAVEAALLDNMKKAASEADKKLLECKSRYQTEMESMKLKYENEMHTLIRENAQKQNLIAATAQQLQTGELAISQTTDRLQNIVSNIVKPQGTSAFNGVSQRRGSESNGAPPSYQILNGHQHSSKYSRSQPQSTATVDSSPASQGNFDPSLFTRYNTSTPIVSLPSKSNNSLSGSSSNNSLKQSRPEIQQLQLPPLDHLLSNPKLFHVITKMSVSNQGTGSMTTRSSSAACTQLVNPLSSAGCGDRGHIPHSSHHHKIKSITQCPAAYLNTIEPPIAAEILARLGNTRREDPEIVTTVTQLNHNPLANRSQSSQQSAIEPGLHKCLQALVKCYTERLDQRQLDANKNSSPDNEHAYSATAQGFHKNKNSFTHNLASVSNHTNNEPEVDKSIRMPLPENKASKSSKQAETNVDVGEIAKSSVKNNGISLTSKRPWK